MYVRHDLQKSKELCIIISHHCVQLKKKIYKCEYHTGTLLDMNIIFMTEFRKCFLSYIVYM